MKTIFYFFLSIICLTSCLDSSFDTTDLVNYNDINYLDQGKNRNSYPNDAYRIVGITPQDNNWHVIVEYSGGCEEHVFYTWWDGDWKETNPKSTGLPEADFWLMHDGNDDSCERLVRDTLHLDLQSLFQSEYPEQGAIITVFNASSGKKITIDPALLFIQEQNCDLKASLVGSICGDGIWGNQWLLLDDTVERHERIWLQPVKNSAKSGLNIPASGRYKIGVNLLFGFHYGENEDPCNGMQGGTIIPAFISCMEGTE